MGYVHNGQSCISAKDHGYTINQVTEAICSCQNKMRSDRNLENKDC